MRMLMILERLCKMNKRSCDRVRFHMGKAFVNSAEGRERKFCCGTTYSTNPPNEILDLNADSSATRDNIPYYRPSITPQRYREIRQFLIGNHQDLARDNMDLDLELSENVLRKYILTPGNFALEVDEWRASLISCPEEH